ncbi:MAG TPA: histidine phosphatase family protein [Nocardioidaceae bacterium]|nr:histidine phosphatase family protein [Nocardioidaceae bacterium]
MSSIPPSYDGGRRLYLVRHGRPRIQPDKPASSWPLDPDGLPGIDRLRSSGLLPERARWFSSPEPKAQGTARRLTDSDIIVVDELREQERAVTPWFGDRADWEALVRRVFAEPDRSALPGWEPLSATRDRLLPAVRRILAECPDDPLVLVGHGTAWTVLVAELTGEPPDLGAWAGLAMPDLWILRFRGGWSRVGH